MHRKELTRETKQNLKTKQEVQERLEVTEKQENENENKGFKRTERA